MNKFFKNWYWRDLWYKIDTFFNPRQKWLTSKIPNSHLDKDHILEIVILECIKNYVTEEIGVEELFRKNRWSKKDREFMNGLNKSQIKFENELKKIYKLITIKLPALERQLELAWEELAVRENGDYKKVYRETNKLDKKIESLKTKIMNWAVLNRNSMWT